MVKGEDMANIIKNEFFSHDKNEEDILLDEVTLECINEFFCF